MDRSERRKAKKMLTVADKNTEKVSFSFKEFAFDYLFYYKYK